MEEVTIWKILVPFITVVFGLAGVVYGIWRVREKRAELQRYMARSLTQEVIESLGKELAKEVSIKGIEDWKYGYFVRKFDMYDDEQIEILSDLDLERWLNLQKEIIELCSQFNDRDLSWWQIHDVVAEFTQFFDEEDQNLFLGLSRETLEKTLTEIKRHRSAVAARDPAKSNRGPANA